MEGISFFRELKEGAFIRLTLMSIRGILKWKEVQYDKHDQKRHSRLAMPLIFVFLFPR